MNRLLDKLKKVAVRVDQEKGLEFFGLVHRADVDVWDLIVSSPRLEPWSMAALEYVAGHLRKALTVQEMVKISQIAVLPPDHKVIRWLSRDELIVPGRLANVHDADFDQAFIIRRAEPEHALAAGGHQDHSRKRRTA